MTKKYHPYVFDHASRQFVGEFEAMYAAERSEQFDSWQQDDTRHLARRVLLDILSGYNFSRVVDLGCGKGALTHLLKRANNQVIGIDLSPTAVAVATARYPDVDFQTADLAAPGFDLRQRGPIDLVTLSETLSYLPDWRGLLHRCAASTRYLGIILDIPPDPIGHVKSFDELITAVEDSFRVIEEIRLVRAHQIVVFAETAKEQ